MESINGIISEVSRRWREHGITLAGGASLTDIKAFESRFHVKCPDDFKTYLLTLGGMVEENAWDEHWIRFVPLPEIRPVDEPSASLLSEYFVFAEYSLSVHEYGIRLAETAPSVVALIHGDKSRTLAASFAEFLTLYLSNPTLLF